jgi:hypothetical protein
MKALTLYQPWATLVAIGKKRIETRSWPTNYRGPLAIHVSKNKRIDDEMCWSEPFASALEGTLVHVSAGTLLSGLGLGSSISYEILTQNLHLGCVIATCDLIDCQPSGIFDFKAHKDDPRFGNYYWQRPKYPPEISIQQQPSSDFFERYTWELTPQELAFGDFSPGRFMWFLENVKILPEPIYARGARRLWEWSEREDTIDTLEV